MLPTRSSSPCSWTRWSRQLGAISTWPLWITLWCLTPSRTTGLIENILKKAAEKGNNKITVVGSKVCITFLQNLIHMDFKSKLVKDGDTIDLGGGHELEFLLTPNLHWPDTICTYDRKTELLYTCDIFGMHYCSKEITDVEGVEELKPHFQLYYNCLMKPNAKSATTAMKKLRKLAGPVSAVCTGHGPILTHHKDEWLNMYTWSEDALKVLGPAVCIFWVSRHGESERLSQALAFGLTSNDVLVEMHDLNAIDAFEVVEACGRNQVIVVFAPPMAGTAEDNLSSVVASCNGKSHRFLVSASFGENEDPVDSIVSRFVQVGIPEAMPALRLLDGSPEKHLVVQPPAASSAPVSGQASPKGGGCAECPLQPSTLSETALVV
ncbi:unnamed protein product [Prorocentrum cordatum]|uniref:ODP domain-containing protein n=1 Tax=Prorocentrum cordatum TaxID=2364126 RepID=A0ABN9UXZ5_9DINO|nr:unnamed protein product [Polarella glacialis]